MLSSLARFSVRHKRIVVFVIWIPLAIAMVFASSAIGPDFRTEMAMPQSEARQAEQLLAQVNPNQGGVSSQLVFQVSATIDDAEAKKAISDAIEAVDAVDQVDINTPYSVPSQVNKDRTIAFAEISVPRLNQEELNALGTKIKAVTAPLRTAGVNVGYGGLIFE